MDLRANPNLRFCGGASASANANGYGYNPNLTRLSPQPPSPRGRSRSRARRQEQQQQQQQQTRRSAPPSSEFRRPSPDFVAGTSGEPSSSWLGRLGVGWGSRHSLEELTSGGWRPVRPRFEVSWPDEELETDWYEDLYTQLYAKVGEFAKGYFGYGDLPLSGAAGGGEKGLVWSRAGLSEQFLSFVESVAMQDNNAGGWDALLVNARLREYLVMGVLGKALEMGVFDDLLFGADEVQKKMLEAQDECTLNFEGYQRTELRTECVRAILAEQPLTPDFWSRVDQVSLQFAALLLPLIRLMDKHFPASKATSMRSIYQDLHTIVAEAGYLSLGTRWSRNIFRFSLPSPGQVWDIDQENVDGTVFEASQAASIVADRAAEARWRAEQSGRRRDGARRADTDNGGQGNRLWRQPSRIAKVQIVLWPMLERFETTEQLDPETGVPDGERVTSVFKSRAVYFNGQDVGGEGLDDHYPSLPGWLRESRRARVWDQLLPLRWAVYAAGTWLLISLVAPYSPVIDDIQQVIKYGLIGVAKYVGREALLFVIEGLITIIALATAVVNIMLFSAYALRDALGRLLGFREGWLWGAAGDLVGEEVGDNAMGHPALTWESMKGIARGLAAGLFGSQ